MSLKKGCELGKNIEFILLRSGNKNLDTVLFIGSGSMTERSGYFALPLARQGRPLGRPLRTKVSSGCCGCSGSTWIFASPLVCASNLPAWPVPYSASSTSYSDRPRPYSSMWTADPPVYYSDVSEKLSDLLVAVSARGKMLWPVVIPNRYSFC